MVWLKPFKLLPAPLRLILAYMLATPLFWLADILFGLEFRIAFLEDATWKTAYYSVLTGCGLACYMRPGWTGLIAFIESTANVFIHILSFAIPVFTLPGQALNGEPVNIGITTSHILGFVMVGGIMALSFHSALATLRQN